MNIINIKVYPQAKKQEIVKCEDLFGEISYKAFLKSPPEDGKANKELTEVLAAYFNCKKQDVKIIKGELSRNKVVKITPSST